VRGGRARKAGRRGVGRCGEPCIQQVFARQRPSQTRPPSPNPIPPHPHPHQTQRTTGFSFGYNCGYGVLGGISPLAVAAIKAALPHGLASFAPAFWLLALGVLSLIGSIGLSLYIPRLAKPYVGKMA
jgi:hypothetical protein